MRLLIYILIFFTNLTFGQTVKMTKSEVEKYVKTIDGLRNENKLVKVFYPNMLGCGGGLDGYYLNKELVLIDAIYQAELGFLSRTFYVMQDKFFKLIYREHFAEWGKYKQNYPPDKYEWNPFKMTYTDTVYSITLVNPTIFHKKSNENIISKNINQSLVDRLLNCGLEMTKELQEVVMQIDSLKFVTEMPYICENGICGDNLYWEAVRLGKSGIELLIDKLDDTTTTQANIILFGGNYTTADIAFVVLNEIIHDIPTFELLGVPFDQNGCGYCSYWQHLNKDYKNRLEFKRAVKDWYHKNKDNLTWIKNNDFVTCDCRGQHPNRGHYELKKRENNDK